MGTVLASGTFATAVTTSVPRRFAGEDRTHCCRNINLSWPSAASRRKFGVITAGIAVAMTDATNRVMAMSTNLERFKAIIECGFSLGDLTVADFCAEKLIEHEYLSKTVARDCRRHVGPELPPSVAIASPFG